MLNYNTMSNFQKKVQKNVVIKKNSVFLRSQKRMEMRLPPERQKAVVAQW